MNYGYILEMWNQNDYRIRWLKVCVLQVDLKGSTRLLVAIFASRQHKQVDNIPTTKL